MTNSGLMNRARLLPLNAFSDDRGVFAESFNIHSLKAEAIFDDFVQDNIVHSFKAGVLRGLHAQKPPYDQAKLVMCVHGAIFDCIVDVRVGSPTYGEWQTFQLSADQANVLYVPSGFLHGYQTMTENASVHYKVSNFYHPNSEITISAFDPKLDVPWPFERSRALMSEKDANGVGMQDFVSPFHL